MGKPTEVIVDDPPVNQLYVVVFHLPFDDCKDWRWLHARFLELEMATGVDLYYIELPDRQADVRPRSALVSADKCDLSTPLIVAYKGGEEVAVQVIESSYAKFGALVDMLLSMGFFATSEESVESSGASRVS